MQRNVLCGRCVLTCCLCLLAGPGRGTCRLRPQVCNALKKEHGIPLHFLALDW